MGGRVSHIGKVVAVIGTAACVDDDGIRLVSKRSRKGRVRRIRVVAAGGRDPVRYGEEVACKVCVVKVPRDQGGGFLKVRGSLLVVEASEDDAQQRGEPGEGEGLESASGTTAVIT